MVNEKVVRLSIIVPTVGRILELKDFLNSLVLAQLPFCYEVIIVDQNTENILLKIISDFIEVLDIRHYRVPFKGLSRAKNFGVNQASGEFISFPDDDCRVYPDTYLNAFDALTSSKADIVFGKCIDEEGRDSVLKFSNKAYYLTPKDMEGGFVEATAICRKEVFKYYQFDEEMGAGMFYGAQEGFDWLYRLIKDGKFIAFFNPGIKFYHPQVIFQKGDNKSLKRVFSYSCGTAYLCFKHKFYTKYYKRLFFVFLISTIGRILFSKGTIRYYQLEFLGLRTGWLMSHEKLKNGKNG